MPVSRWLLLVPFLISVLVGVQPAPRCLLLTTRWTL
jgi:hypothetical protein